MRMPARTTADLSCCVPEKQDRLARGKLICKIGRQIKWETDAKNTRKSKSRKYSRRRRCRTNVSDTLRKYGINDSLYYRWKAKYGGMDSKNMQRLRELELDKWREKYNNERPHSALNYEPPSARRCPHGGDTNHFNLESINQIDNNVKQVNLLP